MRCALACAAITTKSWPKKNSTTSSTTANPYGHENLGTVAALQKMTVADLQAFYHRHYTQANLIIGLAGGYPAGFRRAGEKRFRGAAGVRDNSLSI